MRKRFGLSHSSSLRETSYVEGESSRPRSIFRTLSKRDKEQLRKHHKNASLDMDSESERPTSRERTNVLGTFKNTSVTSVNSNSSKTSAHLGSIFRTSTPPPVDEKQRRVKRRSSLSDLTSHAQFKPVLEPSLSPDPDPYDTAHPSDVESTTSIRHEAGSIRSNRSAQGSIVHLRRNTTVEVARPNVNSLMPPPPRVSFYVGQKHLRFVPGNFPKNY